MASRGKRHFPFKRESKPVVNETIQFEAVETVPLKSNAESIGRSSSGNGKYRSAASPDRPKSTLAEGGSMSGRKANTKKKTITSARPNIRATEETGNEEDTEEQIESEQSSRASKRPKVSVSTNEAKVKKSPRYPPSEYAVKLPTNAADKSHKDLLVDSVKSICSAEMAALVAYFTSELPGSTHESILAHLKDVLNELPACVSKSCSTDVQFQPEHARAEIVKSTGEQNKLKSMAAVLDKLKMYADDTKQFLKDADLQSSDNSKSVNKSAKKTKVSRKVESFSADFERKLHQMDQTMDQILRAVDSASAVSRAARDSQQKLFDSHQKAKRFETFGAMEVVGGGSSEDAFSTSRSSRLSTGGAVDAKLLLKTMQNRY